MRVAKTHRKNFLVFNSVKNYLHPQKHVLTNERERICQFFFTIEAKADFTELKISPKKQKLY